LYAMGRRPAAAYWGPSAAASELPNRRKKLVNASTCGMFMRFGGTVFPAGAPDACEATRQMPQNFRCPGMHGHQLRYYKRYQMEVDLRRWQRPTLPVRSDYRLLCWSPELVQEHAAAKYQSFRDELDAVVFPCLGELESCLRLMWEIAERDGFLPEATWLAVYAPHGSRRFESCGTIQAIRTHRQRANIQNIGVTPPHRGRGVGASLILASLAGAHQTGVTRVGLEVTSDNDTAVRLYRHLGFRVVKTVYKAADATHAETPEPRAQALAR